MTTVSHLSLIAGALAAMVPILACQLAMMHKELKLLRLKNEHLNSIAYVDELTGLKTRRVFQSRLAELIEVRRRFGGVLYTAILDLDGFKKINDDYGHHAGDEALRIAAGRIQEVVREYDLVARLGGDEFGIIIYCRTQDEAENGEHIKKICQRIIDSMGSPIYYEQAAFKIGCSIGVAEHTDTDDQNEVEISAKVMVGIADHELNHVKHHGKNQFLIVPTKFAKHFAGHDRALTC